MTTYEIQTATTVELEATLALVEYSRIERQRLLGVAIINELAIRRINTHDKTGGTTGAPLHGRYR